MTVPAGTPGDEVPVEDWAEQSVEVSPPVADAAGPGVVVGSAVEADPADLAEQGQSLDLDDEH